jgi:ribosome maturation factor RimP
MASLQKDLSPIRGADVAVWLNHAELRSLGGRLMSVQNEHIVVRTGDQDYYIPYTAIAAVRRA